MAERKAVNKYYPPDWDPSKGSLNKHLGQHPLRERARKLSEGILIIRFEMPFNIWCLGCEQHIGRGVRFNAEKKKVGMYYSTTIWSFRMKCHLCSQWIEIRTDPKHSEYVVVEGARRKTEDGGAVAAGERQKSEEDRTKLQSNPFFRLEHEVVDELRARDIVPKLSAIQQANEATWKDDYASSRELRQRFRDAKRALAEERNKAETIRAKLSIDLPLLPERPEDAIMARNVAFEREQDEKFGAATARLQTDSIFSKRRKVKTLAADAAILQGATTSTGPTINSLLDFTKSSSLPTGLPRKIKNLLVSNPDLISARQRHTSDGPMALVRKKTKE